MAERLAFIGRIESLSAVENSDNLNSAVVVCGPGGKWTGVVRKNEFKVGNICEVYLQDSILPSDDPRFAFMEKNKFRIKMQRFRGAPSEVLIMPISDIIADVGMDITELTRVEKYNKPVPASIAGDTKGTFPSFIPKTDEPNFQGVSEMVEALRGKLFYSSTKCDGSSGTIYWNNGEFGCCSRNLELKETPNSAIWQIAREFDLENKMYGSNIAFQFEVVGPNVQKNPMGLSKIEPRLFNVYRINEHCYLNAEAMFETAKNFGFPTVEIIDWNKLFEFNSDEELRKYAEGLYPNGKQREGIVIRPMNEEYVWIKKEGHKCRLSFKVINLLYKE